MVPGENCDRSVNKMLQMHTNVSFSIITIPLRHVSGHHQAIICENIHESKWGCRGVIGRAGKHKRVGVSLRLLPRRVLQSMWELLLRMILDAIAENRGVQVEFYNRFQYTVEVSDYWIFITQFLFKAISSLALKRVCLKRHVSTLWRLSYPLLPSSFN